MNAPRRLISAAEMAVLEARLPVGVTGGMVEIGRCLFEALVLRDERAGAASPAGDWAEQLDAWVAVVLAQLEHLAQEMGGSGSIYISKGVSARLAERNREMCARFRGNNYRELALEYDLTDRQVREIVDAWQREQFERRQGLLPGLDGSSD